VVILKFSFHLGTNNKKIRNGIVECNDMGNNDK
jgi:hypothetical protein